MRRLTLRAITALAFAALVTACGSLTGTTSSSVTGPSVVDGSSGATSPGTCAVGVSGLPASVDAAGGRYPLAFGTTAACSWTAKVDASWADVAPGSGVGDATAVLTVQANPAFDTRSLALTINGHVSRIVQSGRVCSYAVSPTALDLDGRDTAATVSVTAPAECTWSATASESWIRVAAATGRGNGTVTLQVDVNAGDVRHAFLTVAGQRVAVTQRRAS